MQESLSGAKKIPFWSQAAKRRGIATAALAKPRSGPIACPNDPDIAVGETPGHIDVVSELKLCQNYYLGRKKSLFDHERPSAGALQRPLWAKPRSGPVAGPADPDVAVGETPGHIDVVSELKLCKNYCLGWKKSLFGHKRPSAGALQRLLGPILEQAQQLAQTIPM
jgi:hypothetical protein